MVKTGILLFCLCSLISCNRAPDRISESIRTHYGMVEGVYNDSTGVFSFKGIPYATPPVGEKRWKEPEPPSAYDHVLTADEFGAICMQPDPVPFLMWTEEFIAPAGNMSEDCLTLNIWTKEGRADSKRPVMVFIHGGGFMSGSGSVPVYNGERMAERGAVFVTINYRVGLYGFLAHQLLSGESEHGVSGNYGLMDQIAALQWVRDNIGRFGGDPENVTIAGQSAGAFSVNYLTASPLAAGLFHRAIAESGGAMISSGTPSGRNQSLTAAEQQGSEAMRTFENDTADDLRSLTTEQLNAVQGQFGPVIDGVVLPEPLYEIYSNGNQHDVPLLLGWNANEGNLWWPAGDAVSYRRAVREMYGDEADEVLDLFPGNTEEEAAASSADLGSLSVFGLQSWIWANLHLETGTSNVYLYHFEKNVPHSADQQPYGAFHTGEVPYAYNTLHLSDRPWQAVDRQLAENMSDYWFHFAAAGNPNGNGLPEWPDLKKPEYPVMYFGDSIYTAPVPMRERLELLEKISSP
jgi:para-nitrobenzyl esterase